MWQSIITAIKISCRWPGQPGVRVRRTLWAYRLAETKAKRHGIAWPSPGVISEVL